MPILDAHSLEFFSKSPEQTRRLGMRLGAFLQAGDAICLQGDLGAGKTTFVQGVAQGWGSLDPASSPTFVLVNDYTRSDGCHLAHLDAYRIDSLGEAEELDLDALLVQGAVVVEWPERIEPVLPPERLWVNLEYESEEHRSLCFHAVGQRNDFLVEQLRRNAFGVV
jgi:tRNA threonylcarbamoyladenosine biosynthesis protein TsaE